MKRASLLSVVAFASFAGLAPQASAQATDPYLGQVMQVAFNFCPKGWIETNGQFLVVAQNAALFSLLGTTYGGNGVTTFALPDLRGRVAVHSGTGAGLAPVVQGQQLGTDFTTLTTAQMPVHNHVLHAALEAPDTNSPDHALLGTFAADQKIYVAKGPPKVDMRPTAIDNAGGAQPFDQHQPSLGMKFCISLQGVVPPKP
jgi:microcystin-dependent protein